MVQMKNGKPVVPAAGNKESQDIHMKKPSFEGGKKPKGMDVIRVPITIEEGFGNQYRTNRDSVMRPDNDCSDEISRNGK